MSWLRASPLAPNSPNPGPNQRGFDLIIHRKLQMNQVGGSGIGSTGVPPQQHQQMEDVMGLSDPTLAALRNNFRERISELAGRRIISRIQYAGRSVVPADWQRRLPDLARRIERVLFAKHPNKREYYNMTMGPFQQHFDFAARTLIAQRVRYLRQQQMSRQRAASAAYAYAYGGMIPAPGATQGEAPNEHVSTELSLGLNSSHGHSGVSSILATHAPGKEVRKEPKFSCPVCMNELVNASSTICGHIFCQKCIKASIQAQKKCPTCRRTLAMNNFHRVYLPTTTKD